LLSDLFKSFESEAKRLVEAHCVLPAYEMVLKCSHTFNLLDARGAISVTERAAYIDRVRALAKSVARAYYTTRKALGFPIAKDGDLEFLPPEELKEVVVNRVTHAIDKRG